MSVTTRLAVLITAAAALAAPAVTVAAGPLPAPAFADWPAYLDGTAHPSVNPGATAITPAAVPGLTLAWKWTPAPPTMTGQPAGTLYASPTVVDGRVYMGANTGVFYALDEATGHVVWQRFLGFVTHKTCASRGIISTATVAPDPVSGALTVYVAGADGYLYALSAATGAVVWRSLVALPSSTVNDYYNWSSPTVVHGRIYMGVSSQCDSPLVVGGLKEYDQATGALLAFYQTNPGAAKGASIWSSAGAPPSGKRVFVTTGNGPKGDSDSIVELDGATLAKQDSWQVPSSERIPDSDFGGSSTLFAASLGGITTRMVGACNKNGVYYALRRASLAAGPVWRFQAGGPADGGQCDAAAVWDGSHLFVAGNDTVIGGRTFAGSVRMLDPATGAVGWQTGLGGPVIGTPTLDGAGVLAAPTYNRSGLFLITAATGSVLRTIATGPEFGQPVFAGTMLLIPTKDHGLWVYKSAGQ
jgi:outer membrane protein assembly factor BamB